MTNKVLGILVVLLGLVLLSKLFMSSAMLFLVIAALLALASVTGVLGRTGYLLAGLFLLLAVAGSTMRLAFGAIAMLFKMLPLILVLVGAYLLVRAIRK